MRTTHSLTRSTKSIKPANNSRRSDSPANHNTIPQWPQLLTAPKIVARILRPVMRSKMAAINPYDKKIRMINRSSCGPPGMVKPAAEKALIPMVWAANLRIFSNQARIGQRATCQERGETREWPISINSLYQEPYDVVRFGRSLHDIVASENFLHYHSLFGGWWVCGCGNRQNTVFSPVNLLQLNT